MILATRSLAKVTETRKGTVIYYAPELVSLSSTDSSHSKESDIWAFGMTIYVRTTGSRRSFFVL